MPPSTKDRRRSAGSLPGDRDRRESERRRDLRFPVELWVEAQEGEALYFQRVGDLSAGGCSFLQTVPHPVGTQVRLRFTLPDGSEPGEVSCGGEIVSARSATLGMGVRFLGLETGIRERLRRFAEGLGREAGSESLEG